MIFATVKTMFLYFLAFTVADEKSTDCLFALPGINLYFFWLFHFDVL